MKELNKLIIQSEISLSNKQTQEEINADNRWNEEDFYEPKEIKKQTKNVISILIKIKETPYFLKCFPYKNHNWKIKIINKEERIEKEISKSISTNGLIKLYSKLNTDKNQFKSIFEIINYSKKLCKKIKKKK